MENKEKNIFIFFESFETFLNLLRIKTTTNINEVNNFLNQ